MLAPILYRIVKIFCSCSIILTLYPQMERALDTAQTSNATSYLRDSASVHRMLPADLPKTPYQEQSPASSHVAHTHRARQPYCPMGLSASSTTDLAARCNLLNSEFLHNASRDDMLYTKYSISRLGKPRTSHHAIRHRDHFVGISDIATSRTCIRMHTIRNRRNRCNDRASLCLNARCYATSVCPGCGSCGRPRP